MANKLEELLQRPLYVYDLPQDLLNSLRSKDLLVSSSLAVETSTNTDIETPRSTPAANPTELDREDPGASSAAQSCGLCSTSFRNLNEQRLHVKSDWHGFNLKQKLKGQKPISEGEFERLLEDLEESISGSDSTESEDEERTEGSKDNTLTALLKKQARLAEKDVPSEVNVTPKKGKRGAGSAPLLWFSSLLLPTNTSLGIYKALLTQTEQQPSDLLEVLRQKQLKPVQAQSPPSGNNGVPLPPSMTAQGPNIFLCMIGGGHFAAMIVSLTPKVGKKANGIEERQAIVIAHKTFHRYTTRRKQGGSQSTNDSSKGAAHSAGAGIRRYNEVALESEVRALLSDWRDMINKTELMFVRASGTTNRRTLFGPYEDQVLRLNDPRNRTFPFSTRRATQAELMRAFVELTRMKVSHVDEAAVTEAAAEEARKAELATRAGAPPSKPVTPKLSKEEETAQFHTSQLQALIRRSKAPAVLSYLTTNQLSPNFLFQPQSTQSNHHASTPLHLAASINSAAVVLALLVKGSADPTALNWEGRPSFDLAGDRATRDTFRVARFELGEKKWDWEAAHCPTPLSKAEAEKRDETARKAAEDAEADRRRIETDRLKAESLAREQEATLRKGGKPLGMPKKTGAEQREVEARGLTPEMRAKLERERRARAAEERMRRMAGGGGGS
ncbi:MAG: hypothetical protein MMC33_003766 [Icmadophila ericetorum]|nr:hypothetical protein [Icmadophila ericetorum]